MMKTILFHLWMFMFLLVPLSLIAQDIIVTQDGNSFQAYNVDVAEHSVYFQLSDTMNASIQQIVKSQVLVIKKHNGLTILPNEQQNASVTGSQKERNTPIVSGAESFETDANITIGSLIEFRDGTKGIVFYLDKNGHGLAVYLHDGGSCKWQYVEKWKECIDVKGIPNEQSMALEVGLGNDYSKSIANEIGLNNAPAVSWCYSIADGWYLPSLGELKELLVVANESKGTNGPISKALYAYDGNGFNNDCFYMTSSEMDNTDVFAIKPKGGRVGQVNKYDSSCIRAVRMF